MYACLSVVYSYADACINHIDTIIKTSDTVLRKIYLSLYLKGCVWEGVGDWTELQHIDSHSIGHNRVSFPFSWAAQSEVWEPTLLGAGFLYRILSPTGLVSKLNDFLSSPSYIIVQRSLLLVGVTIALIQPIYGQGYNSDIPRPNAPVIYIGAFPILTARPGRKSIYNIRLCRGTDDCFKNPLLISFYLWSLNSRKVVTSYGYLIYP